jgi:hypothetical protein
MKAAASRRPNVSRMRDGDIDKLLNFSRGEGEI